MRCHGAGLGGVASFGARKDLELICAFPTRLQDELQGCGLACGEGQRLVDQQIGHCEISGGVELGSGSPGHFQVTGQRHEEGLAYTVVLQPAQMGPLGVKLPFKADFCASCQWDWMAEQGVIGPIGSFFWPAIGSHCRRIDPMALPLEGIGGQRQPATGREVCRAVGKVLPIDRGASAVECADTL